MSVSCWGAGGKGQCGPKRRDLYEPVTLESLRGIQFVAGAGGEAHTLLLSEFGRVWAFGRNKEGQLGIGLVTADGGKEGGEWSAALDILLRAMERVRNRKGTT